VIAFSSGFTPFRPEPAAFTEASLRDADRFLDALAANGGTEMLEPLLTAVRQAPDGVVVLLTDGQVGNEDEILRRVLEERRGARVFSFGIGTNVSDALLTGLARQTGGAVESIYPGERIDEKVVAQFARATAERVRAVSLSWQGVSVGETAPAEPPALVDGEPWVLAGRYEQPGEGSLELKGIRRGRPFAMTVPVVLPARQERPHLAKLWAKERVDDLLAAQLVGRRAQAMKERILALALEHGIATPYTSFLVVETRTGARRAAGQPETRFVPVSIPYGWDMFAGAGTRTGGLPAGVTVAGMVAAASAPVMARDISMRPPAPGRPAGILGGLLGKRTGSGEKARAAASPNSMAASVPPPRPRAAAAFPSQPSAPADPVLELLSRQLASGLWDGVAGTVTALLALSEAGITVRHRLHGPQVEKAVDALLLDAALAERALLALWLVTAGRSRKRVVEAAAARGVALPADEVTVRRRLAELGAP